MNLGNKIRELRKRKGITQEQLASTLSISPQAVSKWEMGTGYPDMSLIPIIAGYFEVSLDVLFDYDASKIKGKVENILAEGSKYFWSNFEKAEEIYQSGIEAYPGAFELKSKLLSLYECHMRSCNRTDLRDKAITIAEKLISESSDFFIVSNAKADLASVYLMSDRYEDAKKLIDSLPVIWPSNINDRMRCSAYMLKGKDRLESAENWKPYAHQDLFICCELEGEGYFEIGEYEKALASFIESVKIIELFLKDGKVTPKGYPIDGTQSNHCHTVVAIAACCYKLGKLNECEKALDKAYRILTDYYEPEWFEANQEWCMEAYRSAYHRFGLDDYKKCI